MSETNENMELTAGQMLRLARTTGRRKRELNTIARMLCIREEFLEALENDDFARIPELVYILGFARNYAMELELDPYEIVDKIKHQMGLIGQDGEEEAGDEAMTQEQIDSRRPSWIVGWLRINSRRLLVAMVLLIVAGGAMVLVTELRDTSSGNNAPEVVEIANTKMNLPIHREYGLRNRDYASIVLQATGTTWVQIKNSAGTVIFEHSMVAGDVYYALNGSTATIGNAGALDVWVNGREAPKIGPEHQRLLDLLLTPENLVK